MTTKLQFQGFIDTPNLWEGDAVFGMTQMELQKIKINVLKNDFNPKLRLGKLVENFVFEVLNQSSQTDVIAENIQVRKEKISIGEIDCILKLLNEIIHLEIVYKFYLYNEHIHGTNLHKWIGPNKKDDLIQKLTKLKNKQLPILFREETKKAIEDLNIKFSRKNILQMVLFKAQLFVPKYKLTDVFPDINNDCIKGFYINSNELETIKLNEFYIPSKKDWLIEPQIDAEWLNYNEFNIKVKTFVNEQRSPMCWLKNENDTMQKFFVVWWE